MGESLEKTCKSREEFEERITEIDIELNKFGNSRILGSEFDKDSIMEYNSSTNHVTQWKSKQGMHAEVGFPYENHAKNVVNLNPSQQPSVNEAELVSVPITQNMGGDITNAVARINNTVTVELRKKKKKQGQVSAENNMMSLGSTRTK